MLSFIAARGHMEPVPTDKVVPLRMFDDYSYSRDVSLYTTLLFDCVLDPAQLRDGLETLASRPGWEKIGARLRLNRKEGRMEHHIPCQFTPSRPAIRFVNIEHDLPIAKHPVACRMTTPRTTRTPQVTEDTESFKSLWAHPSLPTKFSDYLRNDEPQMGLIVVSFRDATIVVLSWFHSLFDGTGQGDLLRAWSLIVNGHGNEVGTPLSPQVDPLSELGRNATKPHTMESSILPLFQTLLFLMQTLFIILFKKHRTHVVFVPRQMFREIYDEAVEQLPQDETGMAKKRSDKVTEGDVLSTWLARLYTSTLKVPKGTINLANAVDWRRTLQPEILDPAKPYLSNCVGLFSVLIPAQDLLGLSHGEVAARFRKRVVECRTREEIEAYAALMRKSSYKMHPFFGDSSMTVVMGTNWCSAKLFEIGFPAAIMNEQNDVRRDGFPTYIQCTSRKPTVYDLLITTGQDRHGNYWITMVMEEDHWQRCKRALKSYGTEQ